MPVIRINYRHEPVLELKLGTVHTILRGVYRGGGVVRGAPPAPLIFKIVRERALTLLSSLFSTAREKETKRIGGRKRVKKKYIVSGVLSFESDADFLKMEPRISPLHI